MHLDISKPLHSAPPKHYTVIRAPYGKSTNKRGANRGAQGGETRETLMQACCHREGQQSSPRFQPPTYIALPLSLNHPSAWNSCTIPRRGRATARGGGDSPASKSRPYQRIIHRAPRAVPEPRVCADAFVNTLKLRKTTYHPTRTRLPNRAACRFQRVENIPTEGASQQ